MRISKQLDAATEVRILIEDALKHIYKQTEDGFFVDADSVAGALSIDRAMARELLAQMVSGGFLYCKSQAYSLTDEGRKYALHIIRAHRLYETYLASETGESEAVWHKKAEVEEHRLTNEELNHLADRMGNPRYDPHGDPIPTREGEIGRLEGRPLPDWPIGKLGVILHIEDEPLEIFKEISKLRIAPEMRVRVLEVRNHDLGLDVDGMHINIRMACAGNILVGPVDESKEIPVTRLSNLERGEVGHINGITASCRGAERRRLLDLGIVPGSTIEMEYSSPFHSPTAYLVRGTLIALRREQADQILITKGGGK